MLMDVYQWLITGSIPVRLEWWREGSRIIEVICPLEAILLAAAGVVFAAAFASWSHRVWAKRTLSIRDE